MLCELKNLKRKPVDRPAVFWAVFTACKAEVTCVMHEAPPYGTTVFTADGPFPSRKPIQPSIKKKQQTGTTVSVHVADKVKLFP